MNEGTLARLEDIFAAIEGLERATAGKSLEQYRTDWLLRMATQRAVEIISEASRHIPPALRDAYPIPTGARLQPSATCSATPATRSMTRSSGVC